MSTTNETDQSPKALNKQLDIIEENLNELMDKITSLHSESNAYMILILNIYPFTDIVLDCFLNPFPLLL